MASLVLGLMFRPELLPAWRTSGRLRELAIVAFLAPSLLIIPMGPIADIRKPTLGSAPSVCLSADIHARTAVFEACAMCWDAALLVALDTRAAPLGLLVAAG